MNLIAALAVAGVMSSAVLAQAAPRPKVGDPAPLFTGQDQDGKTVALADLIGKKIVLLYFYPKDFTSGCTKEACGFRDRMGDLQKDNVEVVGVSFDSARSHQKFITQYKLNFSLLADPDGKIVDLYGVRMDHMNVAHRVSFLIGLDGKIAHVTDAGNPAVHFDQMEAAIAALKAKSK
ncbi:MAG TPA: peroxiredoxin [Candidatus Sulfopaludibacter sp.]|nr:peroxiredoxin [Candidatus Sulfopaludibacter sp.]